jgi:SpoIIAA-like
MIRLLSGFADNVLAVACEGQVTRKDYEDVLIPAAALALERHPKVRVYYEITPEFAGIDAGAVWEDFRIGMGHLSRWERIAVVTDVGWIRQAVNAFRFLMPGALRLFPLSEGGDARRWIVADNA